MKFESILNTSGIYALLWDLNSPRDCARLGKFRPEKEKVSLPGAVASCASQGELRGVGGNNPPINIEVIRVKKDNTL